MSSSSLYHEQISLEDQAIQQGIHHYQAKVQKRDTSGAKKALPPDYQLLKKCLPPFNEAVTKYLNNPDGGHRAQVKKVLWKLTTIEVAYIALSTVILDNHKVGLPVQSLAINIARALQDQIDYNAFKEESPAYLKAIETNLNKKSSGTAHRRTVIRSSAKNVEKMQFEQWGSLLQHNVGMKLIGLLIESTGAWKKIKGTEYKSDTLVPEKHIKTWVEEAHKRCEALHPRYMPMVCLPIPWDSLKGGGYYQLVKDLVSRPISNKQIQTEIPGQQVLDTINKLQETPWKVNEKILEVAKTLVDRDGYRLGVIPSTDDVDFPARPCGASEEEFKVWKEAYPKECKAWKEEMTLCYEKANAKKSKYAAEAHIVGIATQMAKYSNIYFPWKMDFRGRMYPIARSLSPQGDDLSKGLLTFAKGKKINKKGAYWLAVHGANCFGEDKISLDERVQWIKDHEEQIKASAADPFEHRFWTEADKPFMFLAFCFEWAEFCQKGKNFVTRLCIGIDGTCNGLQHLSAMMLDEKGGEQVNLRNLDERKDVYNEVAKIVIDRVPADYDNEYAELWKDKITRSIVKRNVMTVPYGASARGMQEQIVNELTHTDDPEYDELAKNKWKASAYLAAHVMDSVKEVLPVALQAMDWFKDCAKVFNSYGQGINWVTPVGMPVSMFKVKTQTKRLKTVSGDVVIRTSLKTPVDKLNTQKQISGIAPNVVHSLDSAHLCKTVLACVDAGIEDFGMVHDSYGCHATDVSNLYQILREEFVNLYSNDVLEDLRNQWLAQLPEGAELPEVPAKGNLNINEVLESQYFFA